LRSNLFLFLRQPRSPFQSIFRFPAHTVGVTLLGRKAEDRPARIVFWSLVLTLTLAMVGAPSLRAQSDPNLEQGIKPYGSYDSSAIDSVNLTNGALMAHIPLVSFPQRGDKLSMGFFIRYNNKGWAIHDNGLTPQGTPDRNWQFVGNGADVAVDQAIHVNQDFFSLLGVVFETYTAIASDGAAHQLGNTSATSMESINASGIRVNWDSTKPTDLNGATIIDSAGVRYTLGPGIGALPFVANSHRFYPTVTEDTNGNRITASSSAGWTDTLGRLIPGSSPTDGSFGVNAVNVLTPGVPTTDLANCPAGTVAARIWSLPGPGGIASVIKLCYSDVSLQSNFQDAGITDTSSTTRMLTTVLLPNLTQWSFAYDSYGDLTDITTPQGGSISYTWTTVTLIAAVGGGESRAVLSRTVNANDGTGAKTWNYSWGPLSSANGINSMTNVVTQPSGNDTVHQMSSIIVSSGSPYYETQVQTYLGSSTAGTLLSTVDTEYVVGGGSPLQGDRGPFNLVPSRITTIWPNGQVSQRRLTFDSGATYYDNNTLPVTYPLVYGNIVQEEVYDYANNTPGVVDPSLVSPGALMRRTLTSYLGLSDSNYRALNQLKLVSSSVIQNGAGTRVAETDYQYDTDGNGTLIAPVSSGTTTQRNTAPPAGLRRGNPTLISRWLNTSATPVRAVMKYYDTGALQQSLDPLLHPTTFDYTDNWYDSSCPFSANTFAYPTQTTDALGHRVKKRYYACTGRDASAQDENDLTNSRVGTTLTYDLMNRPVTTTFPDGGQVTRSYTDTGTIGITSTQLVTTGLSVGKTTLLDGLGRPLQTQAHDPDCGGGTGLVKVDHAYGFDPVNHVRFEQVSTPYCGSPSATFGQMATTNYDALNRVKSVVQPDGSTITTSYTGNCTTVTDEAGKTRKSCTDALGRLTQVFEDPNVANYETDYQYDTLDNLLSVTQKGGAASNWRTRSFTYDSLSRLKCAANPEVTAGTANPASCPATDTGTYTAGTIGYSYDADGNVLAKTAPAPNQTGNATVTTNYSYDQVHRLTGKSYPGTTTPAATYAYDGTAPSGCATTPPTLSPANANPINHRTAMCDGAGATSWSQDEMGRTKAEKRTTNGTVAVTATTSYQYYKNGKLSALTYPGTGTTIVYTANGSGAYTAGRPGSAQDSFHNITYVGNATYAAPGGLSTITLGASISGLMTYNSLLQPLQMFYTTGTVPPLSQLQQANCPATVGTILHRVYNFGVGTNDNGNVNVITNCRDTNRTANYVYDRLNRIQQATSSGPNWGEAYTIDAWGNLTNIGQVTGKTGHETLNVAPANGKNQLPGFGYDAAGNMISNSLGTSTYDAENRLLSTSSAAGYSYVYDGDGRRVKKCTNAGCTSGKLYWMGTGGDPLTESGIGGSFTNDYVFFGGKRIARRDISTGAVHYYLSDHLGSASVITDAVGTMPPQEESDYYPYGGEIAITSGDPNTYKFTGKERDSESGLDNFGARFDASSLGRFMTPDGPLIYSSKDDPQSWNLYSYVRNNPLNRVDPSGHLTIIVPGTWASGNDWNMNMKMINEAKAKFHDSDVRILSWSGKLGGGQLEAGAQGLAQMVNGHTFAPGEQLNVIGHSRGGDVALQSTWHLNHKIDNLITLATPVYNTTDDGSGNNFSINMDLIGTWIDVTTAQDWVAPTNSNMSGHYPGAFNLELNANGYGHKAAHSAIWRDDSLRSQWWQFWQSHAQFHEWWDDKTNTLRGCWY
jgi:RHS repeat-associated protein